MQKVINNLLSNAVKHTKAEDSITLSIKTEGSNAVIRVTDTGSGIDAREVDKIFDRFYQIDQMDSTDASKTGTGIGLALTKGIVELHHGTIRVESELGKGSSFIVNLQLGNAQFDEEQINKNADSVQQIEIPKPENDALLKAELEESAPIKRLPDAKILIVEDNDSIRDMLAGIFKPFYEVLTAADGAEGLALVRSEMPNIVVSDVVMPNMSGTELCKQNKERLQHLPYSRSIVDRTYRYRAEYRGLAHRCGRLHYQTIQHKPTDFPLQQLGELPYPLTGEIQQTAAGSRPNARYEPD